MVDLVFLGAGSVTTSWVWAGGAGVFGVGSGLTDRVCAMMLCLSSLKRLAAFVLTFEGRWVIKVSGIDSWLLTDLLVSTLPPLCGSYSISSFLMSGLMSGTIGVFEGSLGSGSVLPC